MQPIYVKFGM